MSWRAFEKRKNHDSLWFPTQTCHSWRLSPKLMTHMNFISYIFSDHGAKYRTIIWVPISEFTLNLTLWRKRILHLCPWGIELQKIRVSSVLGLEVRNDWKFGLKIAKNRDFSIFRKLSSPSKRLKMSWACISRRFYVWTIEPAHSLKICRTV